MSDHSIAIVPRKSNYTDNMVKAKEILDWLISIDAVKPTPSDCVLGSDNGYNISDGSRLVVNEPEYLPFDLISNGLEIKTERQVFDTGENGMEECICPNCKMDISSEDWEFFNGWHEEISNNLTCPLCNVGSDIHTFKFTPEWGFSNLGFVFWNWPELTNHFIQQFREKLGCDINIVYTHI